MFIIRNDGAVHELKTENSIRESLNPSEFYILNDDETKTIYSWMGSSCSLTRKLIGAAKSREVRGQVGMHYRVIPVDEGYEPPELLEKIKAKPSSGFAKEILEQNNLPSRERPIFFDYDE